MPFSNVPTTQPFTYGLDYYNWPCISGETFPPTLTAGAGTAAYSSVAGLPAIRINTTSVTTGNAKSVWPIMPIYGPRTGGFIGYTVAFQCNLSGAGVSGGFELQVGPSNMIGIHVERGNNSDYSVWAYFAGVAGANIRISSFDANWHAVTMTATTAGTMTVKFGSTTVDTSTSTSLIPPTLIDTTQLSFLSVSNGAAAASSYITNLKLSWP